MQISFMARDASVIILTRLVVEISRVADMHVAVSAMKGGVWLDIKSFAEISVDIIGVVLRLKDPH